MKIAQVTAFVVLLFLAFLGVTTAMDSDLSWWARTSGLVGLAGPSVLNCYCWLRFGGVFGREPMP